MFQAGTELVQEVAQVAAEQLAQEAQRAGLVARYAELALVVRPLPVPRIAPDPDDDVAIGTALAARADCLVTGDGALLSVGTYETVRITGVAETLAIIAHPEP